MAQLAKQQRSTLNENCSHLLVHGTLYAQGYEHETNERDALEVLLEALGYATPYA